MSCVGAKTMGKAICEVLWKALWIELNKLVWVVKQERANGQVTSSPVGLDSTRKGVISLGI